MPGNTLTHTHFFSSVQVYDNLPYATEAFKKALGVYLAKKQEEYEKSRTTLGKWSTLYMKKLSYRDELFQVIDSYEDAKSGNDINAINKARSDLSDKIWEGVNKFWGFWAVSELSMILKLYYFRLNNRSPLALSDISTTLQCQGQTPGN